MLPAAFVRSIMTARRRRDFPESARILHTSGTVKRCNGEGLRQVHG